MYAKIIIFCFIICVSLPSFAQEHLRPAEREQQLEPPSNLQDPTIKAARELGSLPPGVDSIIKEYLLQIMNERDRQYQQRFLAQERAIDLQFDAAEKDRDTRFDASEKNRTKLATDLQEVRVEQRRSATVNSINDLEKRIIGIFEANDKSIDQRFTASANTTTAAFSAAQTAVNKAESSAEKRFDSVNEFRNQLKDQQSTFIQKPEFDARVKSLDDKLNTMQTYVTNSQGRSEGTNSLWTMLIGVGGLIVGILAAIATFMALSRRVSDIN